LECGVCRSDVCFISCLGIARSSSEGDDGGH
jgi:hypothetical protein